MKFRNVALLFILVLIVLAWFTKPGYDDFMKFRQDKAATPTSPPVIEFKNGLVYSIFTISYFDIKSTSAKLSDGKTAAIAIPHNKEKYLGLFGKFWKID